MLITLQINILQDSLNIYQNITFIVNFDYPNFVFVKKKEKKVKGVSAA